MPIQITTAQPSDAPAIARLVGYLLQEIMANIKTQAFVFSLAETEARKGAEKKKLKYYSIAFSIFYCILSNYTLSAQYKVEKLGMNINSDLYDEISPVLSRDGTTMYFTRVASPDFCRTLNQDEIDISATYTEAEYFNELKSIYTQIAGKYVDDPFTSTINQEIIIAESGSSPFDKVYQPGYPPLNNALPNSVCALAPFDQG